MEKTYYYARVSSKSQNLDRQIYEFKKLGADDNSIICDKESGKDLNRVGYQYLKTSLLRDGDTLVIKSLDRLSRNKNDIKNELEYFRQHNITLKIIDIPTSMIDYDYEQSWVSSMVTNILIEVYSSIAESERQTIRQRQSEGIAIAKASGKSLGRKAIEYSENWENIYNAWKEHKIKPKHAIEQLHLKRSTFYKLVKQYEEMKKNI